MPNLLFVCTANQFRSPVAEFCFRRELEARRLASAPPWGTADPASWNVSSAGTWVSPGSTVPLDLVRRLHALGINLDGHQPRGVTEAMLRETDLILVMERSQREALGVEFPFTRGRTHLLTEVARGIAVDIPDPFYTSRCTPQEVAADIRGLIREGFGAICTRMEQPLGI